MTVDVKLLDRLTAYLREHRADASMALHRLASQGESFLRHNVLQDVRRALGEEQPRLRGTALWRTLEHAQLAVLEGSWICFAVRWRIGRWGYLRFHLETHAVEEVSTLDFLRFEEHAAGKSAEARGYSLEVDLAPFDRNMPRMHEAGSIGRGAEYMNRRLASRVFADVDRGAHHLLDFLRVHTHQGRQLLINGSIADLTELRAALRAARRDLEEHAPDAPWSEVEGALRPRGFEAGWGRDAARVSETMGMLLDILEAPSPDSFERFLARIPMIFSVAILSPHGWFGQSDVLGRPDTGGQVVYILDQVRALEQDMRARLEAQGLFIDPQIVVLTRLIPESEGTSCDQRIEPISGTRHARILRVPFRDEKGEVVPQWISRFEIWPYLEQYALDAETELQAELGGRPDLIVGNYSDGNLVASLMAHRMQVTQCTIAHALEKSKYAGSDLRWREQDEHYHFSCQFTADLIAMNTTDFIITSSYQEIAGTQDSLGQYESYSFFTMPGLYRVVHGVDVYDPKFNIVAPGADPDVYFPHSAAASRLTHLHDEIRALVYGDGCGSEVHGSFADESKPLLFTMARMDKIKNITGLAEWYGRCAELRDEANLLIVSGYPSAERSKDAEERAEIAHMHELFRKYELDGSARWIEGQVNKVRNGELYRFVADTGGAFVQPALFEAFGLTVVEAMSSGLPVFATCYGGPLEIIEDGRSGFHVDPNHGDEAAARMAAFFAECRERPERWTQVSEGALARIEAKYTWKGYAERMMTLARIYGFWHHATEPERREARRYLEMFYALQFRPLARAIGS